jgi:hypothetical protein
MLRCSRHYSRAAAAAGGSSFAAAAEPNLHGATVHRTEHPPIITNGSIQLIFEPIM